jgi:hypothetical protein
LTMSSSVGFIVLVPCVVTGLALRAAHPIL